jgi:hypothetical protein
MTNTKEFIRNIYIRIRNKFIVLNNKRRMVIRLETKAKKMPYFVISAKYELYVKWTLRILTLFSIGICFITLQWYVALIITLLLIVIERILETIVFQVVSIYVQPIPEWDNDQWLAMTYVNIKNSKYVEMLIRTEEQARKLHDCIKEWNYGEFVDKEDNIKLSFVIENDNTYVTFLYPSFERRTIKLFGEQVEYDMFKKREMKAHQQIVVSITFCKLFPFQPGCSLERFMNEYQQNTAYAFGVHYLKQPLPALSEEKPFMIKYTSDKIQHVGERPFVKFHVKIKKASELTKEDYEYHYRRVVMERQ